MQNNQFHCENLTLFNADFRSLSKDVKTGSVQAIISDPPYGSGGFTVKERMRSAKLKYVSSNASYQKTLPTIDGDALHPKAWERLMRDACDFSYQSLDDRGVIALFIDWRNYGDLQKIMLETGFKMKGTVVWDKGLGSRPFKNGFRNQSEFLLWGVKSRLPLRHKPIYMPGVLRHATMSNGKVHITQKPEKLMDEIIQLCPEQGTVLDMFMGSGTTGVSALKTGRKFIGMESVTEYFNTAKKRLLEI
jgi:site-specific DNA-methyltransferase (adenine-specific)